MKSQISFECLSDKQLIAEVERFVVLEREAVADLIASLAEFDKRRLYLALGYSSLFSYCTTRLHLSEDATFSRIEAARAARRFPGVIDRLARGDVSLTAVRLLAPHLTATNHKGMLEEARHKTKREVELLIAKYRPLPPVPSTIRKLPVPRLEPAVSAAAIDPSSSGPAAQTVMPATVPSPLARRPQIKPLSAESYRLQITLSRATHDKLRRAQALMRHRVPNGDPAEIFDRALDALLEQVEKTKCASVSRPRAKSPGDSDSRHIPSSVKRDVWKRDNARCAFEGTDGRCGETDFLEYHHVVPYARGGKATVDNIELRCRAHNAYEATREFGLFVREDGPVLDARPIAPAIPARPPTHQAA